MIRTTLTTNTQVLDDLSAFMDDFNRMAADIGEAVYGEMQADFLDELQYYPPPRPNQKYVRTYTLRDGWTLQFRRGSRGFDVLVGNRTPYTKFVVGSLAQARAAAASFQAWMHKGRWPLAIETVEFWLEDFKQEYRERFKRELEPFGSTSTRQRAFTR